MEYMIQTTICCRWCAIVSDYTQHDTLEIRVCFRSTYQVEPRALAQQCIGQTRHMTKRNKKNPPHGHFFLATKQNLEKRKISHCFWYPFLFTCKYSHNRPNCTNLLYRAPHIISKRCHTHTPQVQRSHTHAHRLNAVEAPVRKQNAICKNQNRSKNSMSKKKTNSFEHTPKDKRRWT